MDSVYTVYLLMLLFGFNSIYRNFTSLLIMFVFRTLRRFLSVYEAFGMLCYFADEFSVKNYSNCP